MLHSLCSKSMILLCLSLLIATTAESFASPIVDQSNIGASGAVSGGVPAVAAQTFTVGMSGQLTGFDLRLFRINASNDTGSFVVELRDTTSGIPTARISSPLAALTVSDMVLPPENVGLFKYTGLNHFDISSDDVFVHTGDVLAIDIFGGPGTDQNNGYFIALTNSGYIGGSSYGGFLDQKAWTPSPQYDLVFQTYVAPAVPEPCSLVIFCGIFLVLLRRRVISLPRSF